MFKDAGNGAAILKICGQPFQGINQSKIVKHPRAQSYCNGADIFNGFINQAAHCQGTLGNYRVAFFQTLLNPYSIHPKCRQYLTQFIMKFPGNCRTLFFLASHNFAGKSAQLILCLLDSSNISRYTTYPIHNTCFIIYRKLD